MQPSLQKLYADLINGKTVKAILSDCLLNQCAPSPRSLFAQPDFEATIRTAREELNQPAFSDHDAILKAFLKLAPLPGTLLSGFLEDFLTLFPVYRPLVRFNITTDSPFDTFAQTALDHFCWSDDYWQAAECFAAFYQHLSADTRQTHKKRFLVALANAVDTQAFCGFLKLLPHFMPAFNTAEIKSLCAFLLLNFNQKKLLVREQLILALGLCLSRLPALEFGSITNFLSIQLTHETAKDRIRIAAFSALMQNISRLQSSESLANLLVLWLTKDNLAFQVAACEALPHLTALALTKPLRAAIFARLYQALSSKEVTLWAASLNAFIKVSTLLGEKCTRDYLQHAIDLYETMNDQQKALFIAALPHLSLPAGLRDKLGELVKTYAEHHEAPWLYPSIALFHGTNSQYTQYWKDDFKRQSLPRKIADCQLFQALYLSMSSVPFLTILNTLKAELVPDANSALVVCIAETLSACRGRLSNQQCNEFITLLLPHLNHPDAQEALTETLVTLLAGSEPPERYQMMAVFHRLGTNHTMLGFLKLYDLQKSFQLEQVLPLSPRYRYG